MKRISLKELLVLTIFGPLLFSLKLLLEILPNIEPISLLLMVFTYRFGLKALIPTYIYVGLDVFLHGINIWNVMYLYVWAIIVFAVLPLRKIRKGLVFAVVSGLYGLSFGFLCSLTYIFSFGVEFAFAWFIKGLPYDLIHCVGNFCFALFLYIPLTKVMDKIKL
ncbi:MAG: hypothetical protein IKL94_02900 [Clostridia bacterium]|nr:hypothetical protein [Clostridia bacterium]